MAMGFDGIWFGIIIVKVMEVGLITPPLGLNCYTVSAVVPDVPLHDIFRGIVPFLFMDVLTIVVLAAFPQLSLFIPNHMM